MKKIFYVTLMAVMVMMTACQQTKEDYIKEFEALAEQAKQYEDLTAEEMVEIAAIQAKYAGIQAKKGINKVIDGVKDLFGGKKDKK